MANISKVSRLCDFTNNVLSISPDQAIADFQEYLHDNPEFDKVFLVAVNNKNDKVDYCWWKGRLLCSEAIVALTLCLDDMVRALNE